MEGVTKEERMEAGSVAEAGTVEEGLAAAQVAATLVVIVVVTRVVGTAVGREDTKEDLVAEGKAKVETLEGRTVEEAAKATSALMEAVLVASKAMEMAAALLAREGKKEVDEVVL